MFLLLCCKPNSVRNAVSCQPAVVYHGGRDYFRLCQEPTAIEDSLSLARSKSESSFACFAYCQNSASLTSAFLVHTTSFFPHPLKKNEDVCHDQCYRFFIWDLMKTHATLRLNACGLINTPPPPNMIAVDCAHKHTFTID